MWQFWSFVVTDGPITEGRGFGETVEEIIKTQAFWMEIWGLSLLNEEQLELKKKVTTWWAPHDTQLVCKLEASLLFFSHRCLWRLTWILKNQVMLLLLSPHFLPWLLWEEPWRCMLFQGCGQLLGQQLSTSSRVLLFGKRVLCSLLAAQGAIEVFF